MPSAFHGNRGACTGGRPWLHYGVKPPAGFTVEMPGSPGGLRNSVRLPFSTPMVFDFLSMSVGYVKFAGGFDAVMAPYRYPLAERPSAEYQEGIQLAVLVAGHGLLRWTITSGFLMNTVKLLHEQFELYPEATQGMLPVYLYNGDDPHTMQKWQGDVFNTPVMSIEDWMLRDRDTYGPMTVRPPVPILAESVAPVALPPAPAVDLPPPPLAANDAAPAASPEPANASTAPFDGGTPYRPIPTAPPPAPVPTPANDLLAKYVRRNPAC